MSTVAKGNYTTLEVAGREVRLSNPDKVFFPKPGFTKLDLAEYYVAVEEAAVNQLRERPGTMKRFVDGVAGEFFFQKRVPKGAPDWLETATFTFPSGRTATELVANDAAHLVWAVNLGVVDFNPHPVRRSDLDCPDELRVDLDPTPGVRWNTVRKVAMCVKEVLEDHGLAGFPKTSGSRGIHVNVRIEPRWDYVEVRRAALALAREVERRLPKNATSKWWKEERHGVFVDYNQNARDRTIASGYSVRPVPDARVCCPVTGTRCRTSSPPSFGSTRSRTGSRSRVTRRQASTRTPGRWTGCSIWRDGTRRAASATRHGRRTSPSSVVSRSAFSPAATAPGSSSHGAAHGYRVPGRCQGRWTPINTRSPTGSAGRSRSSRAGRRIRGPCWDPGWPAPS